MMIIIVLQRSLILMKDKMVLLTSPRCIQEIVTRYPYCRIERYANSVKFFPVKVRSAEYIDLMKQTKFDCIIGGIEFHGCFSLI